MNREARFVVDKVPRREPFRDIPINFPPLDNLHLELLENRKKLSSSAPTIKQEPKKRNDRPKIYYDDSGNIHGLEENKRQKTKDTSDKENTVPQDDKRESNNKTDEKSNRESHKTSKNVDENKGEKSSDNRVESEKSRTKKEPKKIAKKERKKIATELEDILLDPKKKKSEKSETKNKKNEEYEYEHEENEEEEGEEEEEEEGEGDSGEEEGEDGEEEEEEEEEEEKPNKYAGMTPEQIIAKKKEKYIWRFKLLRKSNVANTSYSIPDYNEHDDLDTMKNHYKNIVKEIKLDKNIHAYKTYLYYGFVFTEYFSVFHLGIDIRGFTQSQLDSMNAYDELLVQLGERSYNRWGENLPVEVRLLGFILFQAGTFYMGKVLTRMGSSNVSEFFKGVTGQRPTEDRNGGGNGFTPPGRGNNANSGGNRRSMRGPSINADDIKRDLGKKD